MSKETVRHLQQLANVYFKKFDLQNLYIINYFYQI